MFVQKIKKVYSSEFELAEKYYSVISALNNISLTTRQTQLLAFLAVRGTLSSVSSRKEFCERYNSSNATINNLISDLKEMKLVVKENNKIKVNSTILPKFTNGLGLSLTLNYEQTKDVVGEELHSEETKRETHGV